MVIFQRVLYLLGGLWSRTVPDGMWWLYAIPVDVLVPGSGRNVGTESLWLTWGTSAEFGGGGRQLAEASGTAGESLGCSEAAGGCFKGGGGEASTKTGGLEEDGGACWDAPLQRGDSRGNVW